MQLVLLLSLVSFALTAPIVSTLGQSSITKANRVSVPGPQRPRMTTMKPVAAYRGENREVFDKSRSLDKPSTSDVMNKATQFVTAKVQEVRDYNPMIALFRDVISKSRSSFYKRFLQLYDMQQEIDPGYFKVISDQVIRFDNFLDKLENELPKTIRIDDEYELEEISIQFAEIRNFYVGNLANAFAVLYAKKLDDETGNIVNVNTRVFFRDLERVERNVVREKVENLFLDLNSFKKRISA